MAVTVNHSTPADGTFSGAGATAWDAAHTVSGAEETANKGVAGGYASLDGSGTVPDAQIPATIARDAEVTAAISAHEAAADPHTGYQKESEKDAANGYAGLNASTKLSGAQQTYGAALNTACEGNDARLSDARTPTAHQASHVSGADQIPTFTDLARGLVPASGGGTTNFLRADGTFSAPPGGAGGDNISVNATAATDADFDDLTPAAPAGGVNVKWQKDAGTPNNISAHLAANDVSNTVLADMAAATVKGRAVGAGTGDPVDLTATQLTAIPNVFTSALQGVVPASGGGTTNFLRADGTFAAPPDTGITQLTSDVTAGPGSGSQAATIAANAVTYAKMQDISATQRVIGRNTAGAGDPEEVTASQALDWIGSTRGSILFRGVAGWSILAPGASGDQLTSNGAGADPTYQAAGGAAASTDFPVHFLTMGG